MEEPPCDGEVMGHKKEMCRLLLLNPDRSTFGGRFGNVSAKSSAAPFPNKKSCPPVGEKLL